MLARTTRIVITMTSSSKVKPCAFPLRRTLPIFVQCAIERSGVAFRINVKNIFAAPGCRIRLVFVRSQSPIIFAGYRINRYPAQEADFRAAGPHYVSRYEPLDQHLEIL